MSLSLSAQVAQVQRSSVCGGGIHDKCLWRGHLQICVFQSSWLS